MFWRVLWHFEPTIPGFASHEENRIVGNFVLDLSSGGSIVGLLLARRLVPRWGCRLDVEIEVLFVFFNPLLRLTSHRSGRPWFIEVAAVFTFKRPGAAE